MQQKNLLDLATLIDLETQLERDKALDRKSLRKREREIGLQLDLTEPRKTILIDWLEKVRDSNNSLPGQITQKALTQTGFLLSILGFILGSGTAAGLLAYDGSKPVNVVNLLAVFVFLQIAILLITLSLIFFAEALKKIPGINSIIEFLELFSPGNWSPVLIKILPANTQAAFRESIGQLKSFDRLYRKILNGILASLSQKFALCFNLGALLCCLALIIFSDLAFAWSTTLQVEAEGFHKIISALAAPWSWFAADASPSLELINQTRFYRNENTELIDAKFAAQWWPFLVMCITFYGLFPRLILLIVSRFQLANAIKNTELDHAGYQRLFERLTENLCETNSDQPDNTSTSAQPVQTSTEQPSITGAKDWLVIDWCGAAYEKTAVEKFIRQHFKGNTINFQTAGTINTEQDEIAIQTAENLETSHTLAILVKAWESPTRDLLQFIKILRSKIKENTVLTLIPIDQDSNNNFTPPNPEDLGQWTSKITALGDPWLRIETIH